MRKFNKVSVLTIIVFSLIFYVSSTALAASAINLGTADNFAVLGGSTITNTGSTVLNGDLGLSPGTSVTGFPPGTVNGTQYVTDAIAAQAKTDLNTAYSAASGQTGAVTVSGDLGGLTLTPGVYNSSSSLGLTGTLTLDGGGNPNAVFIFQVGSALTTGSGSKINLTNDAQACNVFWQVGSSATLGTNSNFIGSVMASTSITATTGTSISGRVLALNGAVTLDTNPITVPTCASAPSTPPPAPTSVTPPVIEQNNTPALAIVVPPTIVIPPTPTASSVVTPTPGLPKTGFPPRENNMLLLAIFSGVSAISIFLYFVRKKQTI